MIFSGFLLKMFDTELTQLDSIIFLGITIDSHLSWQQHTHKLCQQLRPLVGLLYINALTIFLENY